MFISKLIKYSAHRPLGAVFLLMARPLLLIEKRNSDRKGEYRNTYIKEVSNLLNSIHTERLHLREIKMEDAPSIYASFSKKEVTRYYGMAPMENIIEAHQLISSFSRQYQEKKGIRWGIELKGQNGLIGTAGFNQLNFSNKRAEIGYEIHPDFWGKGYAREAAAAILEYGFMEMGLNRVAAVVYLENTPSSLLLKRLGFQLEGILKEYICQDDIFHDVYMFSLLKSAFMGK